MGKKLIAIVALIGALLASRPADAASDLVYTPYDKWNGKKIYLSPARHADTGGRGECRDKSENGMAYNTAWHATSGRYYADREDPQHKFRSLRSRGYMVRIGRGTVSSAVSNSNAWVATLHIPIHSNADYHNQCKRTDPARFGTVTIYKSYGETAGEGLARWLGALVGSASPGSRDYACHNSSACTNFDCLAELCSTRARSAYLEAEFHTWNRGVDFTSAGHWWAWRIGYAVDNFLGYPR